MLYSLAAQAIKMGVAKHCYHVGSYVLTLVAGGTLIGEGYVLLLPQNCCVAKQMSEGFQSHLLTMTKSVHQVAAIQVSTNHNYYCFHGYP